MQIKTMLFAAVAAAGLAAGDADARQPTFDEVMAVHKVLQGDGCDYVYLGMGERELYVTEAGFEAVASGITVSLFMRIAPAFAVTRGGGCLGLPGTPRYREWGTRGSPRIHVLLSTA